MSIQQRVVTNTRPGIQTTGITPRLQPRESPPPPEETPTRKGRGKFIATILVVLLVAAGAGYWFLLRPMMLDPQAEREPVPGIVLTVDPMNVNLADGRYLRLGFAIQFTDEIDTVEESRVLDLAISVYSGREYAEVLEPESREELKTELATRLDEMFDGQVLEVNLTDYVAQ